MVIQGSRHGREVRLLAEVEKLFEGRGNQLALVVPKRGAKMQSMTSPLTTYVIRVDQIDRLAVKHTLLDEEILAVNLAKVNLHDESIGEF